MEVEEAADSSEADPVVKEVDVYLSKQLMQQLYLIQYPVRPSHLTYDEISHLAAKVKPKQGKLELEVGVNTSSPNYDRSKGEQVAINVDGSGENPFYSSGKMDKQVMTSSPSGAPTKRYALGTYKDGELHLTPLHSLIHMRPSFGYLDKSENRLKVEAEGGDSSQEEEEEAKAVTVKFQRRETAEGKARRLASYDYLRRKHEEELWVQLQHHPIRDSYSEAERQLLYARSGSEVSEFHVNSDKYLDKLIPKIELQEVEKPELPTNVLSMTDLKKMNLGDQVRALLINAKVIRTSQLLSLLPKGTDATAMIRCLQQVALMVQGCWVVKSEVLYPKDTTSAHSGASAEGLCRARDYIMWRFTQSRYLLRKDITPVVKLVAEDVKLMLEQMSRLRVNKGWEFLFDTDTEFINRHPDVVQRQAMIWEAKFKQLSGALTLPQSDIKIAKQVSEKTPATPPKRRRTVSRSRNKSGDRSESMSESDTEHKERGRHRSGSLRGRKSSPANDRRRNSSGNPPAVNIKELQQPVPMDTVENNIANGDQTNARVIIGDSNHMVVQQRMDTDDSKSSSGGNMEPLSENQITEIKKELAPFVREKLCRHYVMKLSELKSTFNVHLTQLPPGHLLGRGVNDRVLEQTAHEVGAIKMTNAEIKMEEPIFAMSQLGDSHDNVRGVLLDFMQSHVRFQTKALRKFIEENLPGTEIQDPMLKKLIREYCDYKSGYYHLKGCL